MAINITDASAYYTHSNEVLPKQHIKKVGKTSIALDFLRDTSRDTAVLICLPQGSMAYGSGREDGSHPKQNKTTTDEWCSRMQSIREGLVELRNCVAL